MSLPILSSQFFEKHAPDLGFFSKWRSLFHWSAQIIPIYEWQDILYVGCLQPPQSFPQTSQKVVFILCDPEALKRIWYDFEGTVIGGSSSAPSLQFTSPEALLSIPAIPTVEDTPSEFVLDLSEPKKSKSETNPGIVLQVDLSEPEIAEKSIETEIAFDDLKLDLSESSEQNGEIKLAFNDLSIETSAKVPLEIPSLESFEDPKVEVSSPSISPSLTMEVELDATHEVEIPILESEAPALETEVVLEASEEASHEALLSAEEPIETAIEVPLLESAEVELPIEEVAASDEEEGSEVHVVDEDDAGLLDLNMGTPSQGSSGSAPSPLISLEPLSKGPLKPNSPSVDTRVPASAQKATVQKVEDVTPLDGSMLANKRAAPSKTEILMKGGGDGSDKSEVTRISIQALHTATADKADSWAEKLFADLGAHYTKSMILLKSGDQVKPWKWDAGFTPSTPAISSVSLLQASPFRIVHRTHKPFHGYVIANDLNQKFFDQWNGSVIPEHLTIAPVMVEDHVIGMLLAIGKKTADNKACLHLVEGQADGIAKEIKASKNKAA
ncbi:MAG: hypothetical protein ACXWC9_05355 [Pseudobdellovibrionaceae bacterium]